MGILLRYEKKEELFDIYWLQIVAWKLLYFINSFIISLFLVFMLNVMVVWLRCISCSPAASSSNICLLLV